MTTRTGKALLGAACVWGAMLAAWSISIYSQIIIYFFGPIYFYVAVRHVLGRLRTRGYRCRVVSQAGVSV